MTTEFSLILLGVFLGFFLAMVYRTLTRTKKPKKTKPDNSKQQNQLVDNSLEEKEEEEWESESDEDDEPYKRNAGPDVVEEAELFANYPIADIKQVLVVNTGLQMGKGKIGAQCGHATLAAYQNTKRMSTNSKYWTKVLEKWNWEGTKKICVKVKDSEELVEIQQLANSLGLPNYLVADAGHTQIAAGSLTVCGIGPATSAHIDLITKDKKLL